MDRKQCNTCGLFHSLSEYSKESRNVDGLSKKCSKCRHDTRIETRLNSRASCHPDRKAKDGANGLCYKCWVAKNPKMAQCHPDKRLKAFGLCYTCYMKQWPNRKKHAKFWNIKNKYGLTEQQYAELSVKTNGLCPICGKSADVVDHCHETGKVRGLLCMKCNTGLGCFEDDLERLRRAIAYLMSAK